MPGHLGENAMLTQHLGHNHLREEDLVDFVQKLPTYLQSKFGRLVKLDGDDQTFTAYFLDKGVLSAQRVDPLHQKRTHPRGILNEFFIVDHIEGGEATGHRQIIAAEGGRMHHAPVHSAKGLLINLTPSHDRAAWHVTTT